MAIRVQNLFYLSVVILAVSVQSAESRDENDNSTVNDLIDCPFQTGLMANPEIPCDHWFYICYEWQGFIQICPADLFFDPVLNECNSWYNVEICSGIPHTTEFFNATAHPPAAETIDSELFDCLKRADGDYPDHLARKPNCSERFFTCNIGKVLVKRCPLGYFYDPANNWCDKYSNVYECSGIIRPPTTMRTVTPPEKLDLDCSEEGIRADPHENCSLHYIVCAAGTAYKVDCPEDTRYDPEAHECRAYDDIFECTGVHKSTPTPMDTTTGVPFTFKCAGKTDRLYADPDEPCSTHYFQCAAGHAYKMPCARNLFFDEVLQDCDFKKNVDACAKFFSRRPLTTRRHVSGEVPVTSAVPTDMNSTVGPVLSELLSSASTPVDISVPSTAIPVDSSTSFGSVSSSSGPLSSASTPPVDVSSTVKQTESSTVHSESSTVHSESSTVHSESSTVHSESSTVHSESSTVHSEVTGRSRQGGNMGRLRSSSRKPITMEPLSVNTQLP